MKRESIRFEMQLPAEQRAELEDLARRTGQSAAALARLSIARLLAARETLLPGSPAGG